MARGYQQEYASGRPQMYDISSREQKADRIIKTLAQFYGPDKLKQLTVLDVGASTGIIDNILATAFKKVVGTDIDKGAIAHAKKTFPQKNLVFEYQDAMKLTYPANTFDVIICTHVYEHVPNAEQLFKEMYRVLKPKGVVYLAAINALWPFEPHYDLPFLSWLPKSLAHWYVRIFGKASNYYESPLTWWGLQKLSQHFKVHNVTPEIIKHPQEYGYQDSFLGIFFLQSLIKPFASVLAFFFPTYFWILQK